MASLRGLGGFEVTSTEIVLDRARRRSAALRIFFDTDKWIKFTITNFTLRQCIYLDIFNQNNHAVLLFPCKVERNYLLKLETFYGKK